MSEFIARRFPGDAGTGLSSTGSSISSAPETYSSSRLKSLIVRFQVSGRAGRENRREEQAGDGQSAKARRSPAVYLKEPARQQAMRESKSAQAYRAALPTAERNLKRLSDAGATIVMGTDSGATAARFEGY